MRRSSITYKVVVVALVMSMYRSGIGNDSSLSVQRDDGECSSLKWTRNHFLLHNHPAMTLKVVVKTRLILQECFLVLLLGLGCLGLRWMFSEHDLLQMILTVPSAIGM